MNKKFKPDDYAKNASAWMWELWRSARQDTEAQRLLRNLAVQAVELAQGRSENNERFVKYAKSFLEGAHGKQPGTTSSFCDAWLRCGLFVRDVEGGQDPTGSKSAPNHNELTRLAISALRATFGNEWQDATEVSVVFNIAGHKYTPRASEGTWGQVDRAGRREVVRKTLRSAARTWERQIS